MAFPSASALGPTATPSSSSHKSYVPATVAANARRNVPSSRLRVVTSTLRTSPASRSRLATFGRFAIGRSASGVARRDTRNVAGSKGSYDASLFQESRVWNTNSESAPAASVTGSAPALACETIEPLVENVTELAAFALSATSGAEKGDPRMCAPPKVTLSV